MLILVTGGSGSGKSRFAEEYASHMGGRVFYVAAMKPLDDESLRRIERHRKMRENRGFTTVERYTDIGGAEVYGTAIIECMSNLLANEMYSPSGAGETAADYIFDGVMTMLDRCENIIIVTNEVLSDGINYGDETLGYMKNLGTLNCRLAREADEVYEVVYGHAQKIKG